MFARGYSSNARPTPTAFFWATLHPLIYTAPSELRCTPLSCAALYWPTLQPTELYHTLLSYTLHEPHFTLMNYSTFTLHPTVLRPTLRAITSAFCTVLSHRTLYWATLHLTNLRFTYWPALHPLCATHPNWAKLHPIWPTLHPSELCCTLLSNNWATHYPVSYTAP